MCYLLESFSEHKLNWLISESYTSCMKWIFWSASCTHVLMETSCRDLGTNYILSVVCSTEFVTLDTKPPACRWHMEKTFQTHKPCFGGEQNSLESKHWTAKHTLCSSQLSGESRGLMSRLVQCVIPKVNFLAMKWKYMITYLCNENGAYIIMVVPHGSSHQVKEFFCIEQAEWEASSECSGV